jgi:hypothetical protein
MGAGGYGVSDVGDILARIEVDAVAAVSGLMPERGVRLLSKLTTGEYPHLFLYDPSESIELLPLQVEQQTHEIQLALVTRDDTQAQILTKMDAIRDGIIADRTLNSLVTWTHISERGIREDDKSTLKIGDMTVVAVDTGGSVFSYEISLEVAFVPGTLISTWAPAMRVLLQTYGGANALLYQYTSLSSDYVVNRDAIGVAGKAFQLQVVQSGYDPANANERYPTAVVKLLVYRHLRETDNERAFTENFGASYPDAMSTTLQSLMDPLYWANQPVIHHIISNPSLSLDGDVGREV